MKLGAARMSGQFITTDPVEKAEFRSLRNHFRSQLEVVVQKCREHDVRELVGSSGTFENIAQVCAEKYGDPDRSIFLQQFGIDELRQVTKTLLKSDRQERLEMKAIDKKRVDQIVAGAMLIDVLLKDLDLDRVRVSSHALRDGMVVYFIQQNLERLEIISPHADIRRRSVYEIGHRFRWDQKHVQHVTAMALQLFDACRPLHNLEATQRTFLEYASLLHDIGYYISRSSHHKHSLYLIRQADWHGFQPEEIDIMANVARYHRRSMPKDEHAAFSRLSEENQLLVRQLASFLRLANGLDRSHYQNVISLRADIDEKAMNILIETKGDPQLEIWSARRASDLFVDTFQREVLITAAITKPPMIDSAAGVKATHLLN
jgi:exopolyphosphatase/guanosine-5'-triphosphate,3'-diphosphate pyrophosphatase